MIQDKNQDNRTTEKDTQLLAEWAASRWEAMQKEWMKEAKSANTMTQRLYQLLQKISVVATEEEGIEFPTLFSRLAYIKSIYELSGTVIFAVQSFRKQVEQKRSEYSETELVALGFWCTAQMIDELWGAQPDIKDARISKAPKFLRKKREVKNYEPVVRGMILGADEESDTLRFLREDDPSNEVLVCWNVAERNDIFSSNIHNLIQVGQFPYPCHLWHVEMDGEEKLYPQAFIFQPDYLVNVTAIAACFKPGGVQLLPYFLNKFLPKEPSAALLKGNVANHFLDGLLQDKNADFLELIRETFRMYPIEYALLEESEMKKLYQEVKNFYVVIQSVIKNQFPQLNMEVERAVIEPSFYHPDLGLQGRLDVLHLSDDNEPNRIIELKSGKAFRPNRYGLNAAHYVQTLLYDLMISYALPKKPSALSYILYCKESDLPLRSAPVAREQQVEALQLRNRIILWEQMLTRLTGAIEDIKVFEYLHPRHHNVAGFIGRDLHQFHAVFSRLQPTEKSYFAAFTGFLAREHQLAKVGQDQSERNYGLAAIWRESMQQKSQRFGVLNALILKSNRREKDHELVLQKSEATDALANFRVGDIAILYAEKKHHLPTQGQVYKCSLIEDSESTIVVRLRNWQVDLNVFEPGTKWNLEHDMLDSGFHKSFQNLFLWAAAPPQQRRLFMGLHPPGVTSPEENAPIRRPAVMTDQQYAILQKMIRARDYFLLWGPPGTGKTSIMLRYFVEYLLRNTDERILLLAYTNRAVDEICSTLETIAEEIEFSDVRIGSTYGVAPAYRDKLLQYQMSDVNTRESLKEFLSQQRVFTATVSSFIGKRHLLDLISFDRVVIDEASQLLEPMMGSIIHDFKKIVMIGDHRQLPAVVQQSPFTTRVKHAGLKEWGLLDLGNSLFERLFINAQKRSWTQAYDQLSFQGRMHPQIMKFPAHSFYDGELQMLNHIPKLLESLEIDLPPGTDLAPSLSFLSKNRLVYRSSAIREEELLGKTNRDEAQKVVEMIEYYQKLWHQLGREWSENTLGVITPFRAQIAQIKKELWASNVDHPKTINVDTVERYQGSARDIIIMSLCVNRPDQWSAICSLNTEGVDRKLNVAMTRARMFFVLIGNSEQMRQQALYSALLDSCVPFPEFP